MTPHDDAHENPHDDAAPQGSGPEGAAPEGATPDAARAADDGAAGRRKSLVLWIVAGVAVALVAAAIVIAVVASRDEPAPLPTPPAVTVTNPLPTPAAAPAERKKGTPLLDALPDTVLQWVVESQERTKTAKAPLESYRLTYTDGAGGTVVVDVVQTRTPEAAAKASVATGKDDPAPDAGSRLAEMPVKVGDRTVGTGSLQMGGERGLAVWTNGTTAFRAVGPGEGIENFFLAFPL